MKDSGTKEDQLEYEELTPDDELRVTRQLKKIGLTEDQIAMILNTRRQFWLRHYEYIKVSKTERIHTYFPLRRYMYLKPRVPDPDKTEMNPNPDPAVFTAAPNDNKMYMVGNDIVTDFGPDHTSASTKTCKSPSLKNPKTAEEITKTATEGSTRSSVGSETGSNVESDPEYDSMIAEDDPDLYEGTELDTECVTQEIVALLEIHIHNYQTAVEDAENAEREKFGIFYDFVKTMRGFWNEKVLGINKDDPHSHLAEKLKKYKLSQKAPNMNLVSQTERLLLEQV